MKSLTSRSKATKSTLSLLRLSLCFKLFSMLPVLAIFVILLTLLRITQHFVCLINRLKLLLGRRIIRIQIWMILAGQLTKSLLNIILRCRFVYSKYFIIINICHSS